MITIGHRRNQAIKVIQCCESLQNAAGVATANLADLWPRHTVFDSKSPAPTSQSRLHVLENCTRSAEIVVQTINSAGPTLRRTDLREFIPPNTGDSMMCLAVPGRIEKLYKENGTLMGTANFGGVAKEVCLVYVPEIQVGDYAIVHVGFAISRIDETSAMETLRTFEELGLLEEELAELRLTENGNSVSARNNSDEIPD